MSKPFPVTLSGIDLINSPRLNKGTALDEGERDEYGLHGLLPPLIGSLELQAQRRERALDAQETDFHKYGFLRDLQDSNETLFYALLARDVEKMLLLVFSPAVGVGCLRFSVFWRL